ncbi:integral membrane protein [Bisporella sp. PMI_857]|nr:integral membrane protein [Bisporella sp. PMI_857]
MAIQATSRGFNRGSFLEQSNLPPVIRPILRAYCLGYASSTTPRLLTLLLTHLSRRRKNIDVSPDDPFFPSLLRILRGGLELQRFPTFCAALVGGSTILEIPLRRIVARLIGQFSGAAQLRLTRWLSAFIAAWYSLKLLQSKKSDAFIDVVNHETPGGVERRPKEFAGRTMDLTLFAVTRAFDVIVGELWSQRKSRKTKLGTWTNGEKIISVLTDSAIFSTSCALIMWAWIYSPDRLPRSYNKWIRSAAQVDERLLTALRHVRWGEMKYGLETGQAHVLRSMCKDYNLPLDYGDPVKSIPFPCEIVHMGTGKSCEWHAITRLWRSFMWAFTTYLPLNLVLGLRKPSIRGTKYAIKSSARSSLFLGTFITLYYYGVCLARTRIGPIVYGTSAQKCQAIDGGICVRSGCMLCGWSILIEGRGRQEELGLFVAPRALATLLPRRYEMRDQWRETLAFAASTAVVFTCVGERPERVRGVLGKVLRGVLMP